MASTIALLEEEMCRTLHKEPLDNIRLELILKLCFTFVPLHLTIGSDKQGTDRATLPVEYDLLSQIVA